MMTNEPQAIECLSQLYKKVTGSAILGVQNATNKKNAVRQSFDVASGKIRYSYLLGLIPVFGYKVDL